MAKEPRPGATKTRLTPQLTPEAAAALYECFLLDALDLSRSIADVTPLVAVFPPEAGAYFRRIAPDVGQVAQVGSSLAERLCNVLVGCLEDGFDQVAAINSDSPTLASSVVDEAFARLADETVDVVLGPTDDGGYYLIGWKRPYPQLIRGVTMSTGDVLTDTLRLAAGLDVTVSLIDNWYDVDEPADLARLESELAAAIVGGPLGGQLGGHHTRRFLEGRREANA